MRGKKELLILIVIIAGLVAYLWTDKADRVNYKLPQIEALTTGKITRVEIKGPEETITLTREDDAWYVGQRPYPASKRLVDSLLQAISGLQVTSLASESENYARYSLDQGSAIRVTAFEGGTPVRSFAVGKTASTQSNTFITLEDRPQIYLSGQNLRMTFDKSSDMFRDKTVLSFPMDQVTSVTIAKGSASLELTQQAQDEQDQDGPQQTAWIDADGDQVDSADVEDLLRPLHSLKCQSYIEDRDKEDFSDPELVITVQTDAGHELSLFPRRDQEDDTPSPATSSDSEYPFEISGFNGQDIVSAADALLGIEPPQDDPSQKSTQD